MILLSHPMGNANVRHAALALAENNLLAEFWTCVSWNPPLALNRMLPRGLRHQLDRRSLPEPLRQKTRHVPWREVGRMLAGQLGWTFLSGHERGPCSIDAVFHNLDRRVARQVARTRGLTGVYAYEDGAALTFAAARDRGMARIYDLPIGYWRAAHVIYRDEAEREPDWACTLTGIQDSEEKLARKDEELRLAEAIVVASSFTRQTIQAAPECRAPVHVIPYGAPPAVAPHFDLPGVQRLRVLFVGSLGQRKGLSYLLRAAEILQNRIELTLLGAKVSENCRPLNKALDRCRWIPSLPHAEVLREMARHDVLVFPSLFEGFGLVILEAMAQGLPVITTAHTAGPDLIQNEVDGFIVPIRSAEAIAEKLDLLAGNSNLLSAMKGAARANACRRSWEEYRSRLAGMIRHATTPTPQ